MTTRPMRRGLYELVARTFRKMRDSLTRERKFFVISGLMKRDFLKESKTSPLLAIQSANGVFADYAR